MCAIVNDAFNQPAPVIPGEARNLSCLAPLLEHLPLRYHFRCDEFIAMNRTQIVLLVIVVVLGLLVAAAVSLLHDGLSARAQPSALETAIARTARKMAAPSGAHNQNNPIADSPDVQREARLHFADHCAICHGNDGSGDTMIGRGLYPKPPDLREQGTQNLSDGDIFWIIQNGVRLTGMPAFGGAGSEQSHSGNSHSDSRSDSDSSWKLVRFIRHLPSLTEQERLEMEEYNPKGPDDRQEEQKENDFLSGAPAKRPSKSEQHHH
jgi:mono/diheme cytochrome c family protein